MCLKRTSPMKKYLDLSIKAALEAGKEILEVYQSSDFQVETKDDKSPLTLADKKAHNAIVKHLETTEIPVLSEEGKHLSYDIRKNWKQLWIVDPLDGTKEFIKRNGEFTVNIALIENQVPILGVIYIPVLETLYFASKEIGSFKIENIKDYISLNELIEKAEKLPIKQERENFVVVGSRSHMNEETEQFIKKLKLEHKNIEFLSRGSSLKFCMFAEGKADIYPRFAPTMEWDTAAGHAIVSFMGGNIKVANTQEELKYNKENLLNTWFIVGS